MNTYKVIFLGTSQFSTTGLEYLHHNKNVEVQAVYTQPDKKSGRKQVLKASPVKKYALQNNISCFQPHNINTQEEIEHIKTYNPDFLIVISYGQILKESLLNLPIHYCINVHASLLPKYRGASPIQESILQGDSITGLTAQKMTLELDAGDIIQSIEIDLNGNENYITLEKKLSEQIPILLEKTLFHENVLKEQDKNQVSFCRKIEKSDGQISFLHETAVEIDRKLRAYSQWPGIFFIHNKKRYKILEGKILDIQNDNMKKNMIFAYDKGKYAIQCKEGFFEIIKIQPEGKQPMEIQGFINGNKSFLEEIIQ